MLNFWNVTVREIETEASLAHKQRVRGQFLRGPIPLEELATASSLPGQALTVLLLVHHRVALTKSQWVTLPKGLLERFGISRDSKARACEACKTPHCSLWSEAGVEQHASPWHPALCSIGRWKRQRGLPDQAPAPVDKSSEPFSDSTLRPVAFTVPLG